MITCTRALQRSIPQRSVLGSRHCSTARSHLAGSPRLIMAYDVVKALHHPGMRTPEPMHRGFASFPTSIRNRTEKYGWVLGIVLGMSAGIFVYYSTTKRIKSVPKEVVELCDRARELLSNGAPMSAALQYEKAAQYLMATGGDPVILLEVLLLLGDTQVDAKQTSKAYDTFLSAEKVASKMLRESKAAVVTSNDIHRKYGVTLDRLASAADALGMRDKAAKHCDAAIKHVQAQFEGTLTAATLFDPRHDTTVFDAKARHLLADIAGIYFNSAHIRLAMVSGMPDHAAREALRTLAEHAARAVLVIASTQTAAMHEAGALMSSQGVTAGFKLTERAINERLGCRKEHPVSPSDDITLIAPRLGACLRRQADVQPVTTITAQLTKIQTSGARNLYDEIEMLAGLESAALNLQDEIRRLQAEYDAPAASRPAKDVAQLKAAEMH